MWKYLVMGVLTLVAIFFFFYGLTQQIKAEQTFVRCAGVEREAIAQKEELQVALEDAKKQAELYKMQFEQANKSLAEALRMCEKSKKKN
jgi:hypothetical protein